MQIWHKNPKARILIAAPSNSAVDLILERLLASGRLTDHDIIRPVSYNRLERDRIPEHLKKFCATIDITFDDGKCPITKTTEKGVREEMRKNELLRYRIVVSTLSSFGTLMKMVFDRDHFTHVIVDEAGQTVESETLIPITFVSQSKGQVILAGDPKQLGPIVISEVAKEIGFGKSFLERLCEHSYYLPSYGDNENEFDPRYVTLLKRNYRSIPSILSIYNHLFYADELQAEVSGDDSDEMKLLGSIGSILWNREKADPNCGFFFINISKGESTRNANSCSWRNVQEIAQIYMFIRQLSQAGIKLEDIGVVSHEITHKGLK